MFTPQQFGFKYTGTESDLVWYEQKQQKSSLQLSGDFIMIPFFLIENWAAKQEV